MAEQDSTGCRWGRLETVNLEESQSSYFGGVWTDDLP